MKLTTLFAFALGVSAAPWKGWYGNGGTCLSDADAQYFVSGSIVYLQHTNIALANQTAQKIFSPDLVEFGDSINALRMAPLGTQVENGRATYVQETLSTPTISQINTLDIVHDCSQIAWHWEFIGIGPQRIRGFTLMKINSQFQIYRQDVEFNSLTWAEDIGFGVTPPTTGPFAPGGTGK